MFKKMVIAFVVMIGNVTTYAMDNLECIKDYYKQSAQSDSAMAMRSEIMYLYEQGRVREAQWLAGQQQLLWHKDNTPFSRVKSHKKNR